MVRDPLATGYGAFGASLIKALGLQDRRVCEVNITVSACDLVKVTIIEHLSADHGDELIKHMTTYHLKEVGNE